MVTFLGIFLFSGLNAVGRNIKASIDEFYQTQNLADYTVTTQLTPNQFDAMRGELCADGAVSFDAVTLKVNGINRNIIVSLFTYNDFNVNIPDIVEGENPTQSFDALIDVAFANANRIKPGDVYTVMIEGQPQDILITGLARFPDHLYKGDSIPQIKDTGVLKVFVDLPDIIELDTLYVSSQLTEQALRAKLAALTGQSFASARVLSKSENVSVVRVQTDIELISSLMNILPAICLIALCLILYVNMSKRIEDESYNIGVMSANGIDKTSIFVSYILPYFIWVMIGGVLGAILGITFLPQIYILVLSQFYTLPPILQVGTAFAIIVPLVILAAITLMSMFIAMASIMRSTPNQLMRGKAKKSVKVGGSKIPVLYRLSLRNFLSYKKKSFFTIVSATLCLGLLFTSFLLDNSVTHLQNTVYGMYYNYDTTINWNYGDDLDYSVVAEEIDRSELFDGVMFCFEFPATRFGSESSVMVSIIDETNPCYNLYDHNGKITYTDEGVYIPESYGKMDKIAVRVYAKEPFVLELPVAGSYKDMGVFGVIVPLAAIKKNAPIAYRFLMENTKWLTKVYTTQKGTEEQVEDFVEQLGEKHSAAFRYVRHNVGSYQFEQLFSVIKITEALLFIVCGIILILLILNISCLSIADRVKDYTVFKAMGVDANKINFLSSLENYFSIIVAFILSLPTGIIITNSIINVVTHITGVVVYIHLYAFSVLILLLGAGLFTAISNIFINKKISKVNIAYTLKIKE
ncbi:MAG: hypothetical protein J1F36_03885 [Clostridiales bacterium]|nr:hypothetical protein [Clostridiales bacterium]